MEDQVSLIVVYMHREHAIAGATILTSVYKARSIAISGNEDPNSLKIGTIIKFALFNLDPNTLKTDMGSNTKFAVFINEGSLGSQASTCVLHKFIVVFVVAATIAIILSIMYGTKMSK